MRFTTVASALSLALVASAQLGGLSSSCQSAAAGLLNGDLNTCANLIQLVGLATVAGSIVPPLSTYLSGVCTQAACSNATISAAQSSIQSGCASDIQSGNALAVALGAILGDYPDTRGLLCTQYTANGTYCLPNVFYAVQNATNTNITIDTLGGLFSTSGLSSALGNIPSSAVCTDCGHAIFAEVSKIVGANSTSAASAVNSAAAGKCGSSFGDGRVPSSVSTSGSAASSSSPSSSTPTTSTTRSSAAKAVFGTLPLTALVGAAMAVVAGGMAVLL